MPDLARLLDSHKDLTISLRQFWPRADAAGKLPVDAECEEFTNNKPPAKGKHNKDNESTRKHQQAA